VEHHRGAAALDAPIAGHDDARLVAFHEAGHLVMCILHRMMPTRVTIVPEVTQAGPLGGRIRYTKHRERWFLGPWRELDVLLAGMVAEARFHARYAATAGAVDRAEALKVARRIAGDEAMAELMVAQRLAAVERRLADPGVWSATVHTATALLARKTLEGRDLLDLCRHVADRVHRPGVAMWRWPGYAALAHNAYPGGRGPELEAAVRRARRWRTVLIVLAVLAGLARLLALR
jgi:hypothetical protein